ncbi:hypothetical protein [Daejeonella sp. JGW-45]|uniref:hypothetical protein n=1 Tax=Daejeonella sp. JGW-45 TaxID=3034148 RepID=UPI0023EBFB4A|nr:hypothetical protein [Daejeonella sp. JGW-45]
MKYERLLHLLMIVSVILILSCSKKSEDFSEPSTPTNKIESLKAATEMSIAITQMNVYHDSLVHHAKHKAKHYEKLYHHHDSLYVHHDKNYHHAIPINHPSNGDHNKTHHNPHRSITTAHQKITH